MRSDSVYRASLHQRLPAYFRLDVTPFVLSYSMLLYYVYQAFLNETLFRDHYHLDNAAAATAAAAAAMPDAGAVDKAGEAGVSPVLLLVDMLSVHGLILLAIFVAIAVLQVLSRSMLYALLFLVCFCNPGSISH